MVVGYKRVSALDRADVRLLDGVETDKLFTDKASGKDTNRPQLTAMLGFVREGDTIYSQSDDLALLRLPRKNSSDAGRCQAHANPSVGAVERAAS